MVGWHNIDSGSTGESWIDGLEWTPVEVGNRASLKGSGRFMIHAGDGFLLPAEAVVEEVRGAVLVNLEIAGVLFVTNYRLVFVGVGAKQPLPLGTIPLLTKQVNKRELLTVHYTRIYAFDEEEEDIDNVLVEVGCSCRGQLSRMHRNCIFKWYGVKMLLEKLYKCKLCK